MPELYTTEELRNMTAGDLKTAMDNGFMKPEPDPFGLIQADQQNLDFKPGHDDPTPAPPPFSPPQDPYDWTGESEQEFTVPSGRKCLLRNADVKQLAAAGILDQVSRLQGLANDLVKQSQGQPPTKATSYEKSLLDLEAVMDKLVPLVVVKPVIWPTPPAEEDRVGGRVYVDSVPFTDKAAIMNKSLGALANFDSFRG
jgi:hypothetical protein